MANVQIHELDSFSGSPNNTDYLAIDNGFKTYRISATEFDSVINAYPRSGQTVLTAGWLSETDGGPALIPVNDRIYILMADSGSYTANTMFRWSGTLYEPLTSGGGSGTSVPTADTVAEFDNTAHMNSTDMTSQEVSDFVDGLDAQGTNLADYVVEQGTSGIWTYRKWNSGIAECWGTTTMSGTWSTWGNHYFIEGTYTYPFTFVSRPSLQAYSPSSSGISNGSSLSVGSYTSQSEDDMKSRCVVALYRPLAGTNNAGYAINLYAIGKWR